MQLQTKHKAYTTHPHTHVIQSEFFMRLWQRKIIVRSKSQSFPILGGRRISEINKPCWYMVQVTMREGNRSILLKNSYSGRVCVPDNVN